MGIVVVGSVALDSIQTDKGSVDRVLGGTAVHFSNAASFLSRVSLLAVVGSDFPQEGFDFFARKKVHTEGLKRVTTGKTFAWSGRYDDMHTAITLKTDLNVFESFSPEIPDSYRHSDFLFLGNINPGLQNEVYEKIEAKHTILDSMNLWIDSQAELLLKIIKKVDIVILNDQEVKAFTGYKNIPRAAQEILKMGPRYIIVKQGEYGASLFGQDGNFCSVPAYPLELVCDPTGAGDSFAGAFVSYLERVASFDWPALQRALPYAVVLASFCVEDFGVRGLDAQCFQNLVARYEYYLNALYRPQNSDVDLLRNL